MPPSARAETASAASFADLLEVVAEQFASEDEDEEEESRRALLAPLFAGEASDALLAFADRLRLSLHAAYGAATELPATSWSDANLLLRLWSVGPEARRELSSLWLTLPGVAGGSGSQARLSLFWNVVPQVR